MLDVHSSTDELHNSEEYLASVANITDAPVKSNSKPTGPGRRVSAAERKAAAAAGESTKQSKKPAKGVLYEAIFCAITGTSSVLPKPSWRIAAVEVSNGIKTPIEIGPGDECARIPLVKVSNLIMSYVRKVLVIGLGAPDYQFTARECSECADYWLAAIEPIPTPSHVRFRGDAGLCWHRVDQDLAPGPTPHFDEIGSRVTNGNWPALMAFVGSMLVSGSYAQQFVQLHGEANDSKSSLLEVIARLFGEEGALAQTCAPCGDHWAEPYPGKRFVYFPDFEDHSRLESGPLKQLVGNDRIFVNPKNKTAYMTTMTCKLMFSINPPLPSGSNKRAIARRLIVVALRSTTAFFPDYQERLWAEIGAFMYACLAVYAKLCPDHGPIPVSAASLERLEARGAQTDDEYQLWFDDFFLHQAGAKLAPTELAKRVLFRFKDKAGKKACYDWLENHPNKYQRLRESHGKRLWYYPNLVPKLLSLETL